MQVRALTDAGYGENITLSSKQPTQGETETKWELLCTSVYTVEQLVCHCLVLYVCCCVVCCCIVGPIPAVVLVAQLVYELLLSVMRCNTAISSLEEVVLFSFALPLPCWWHVYIDTVTDRTQQSSEVSGSQLVAIIIGIVGCIGWIIAIVIIIYFVKRRCGKRRT